MRTESLNFLRYLRKVKDMHVSSDKINGHYDSGKYARKHEPSHSRRHQDDDVKTYRKPSNHVFLNNIKPEQAREFLHSHIGRKIDESIPHHSRAYNTAKAPEYQNISADPASVASSLINKINHSNAAIENESADKSTSFKDLVIAVQQGFSETKLSLEQRNEFHGQISQEFGEIKDQVNQFLSSLEPTQRKEGQPINETTSLSSREYQSNSETSIQIETRDGDIVTIDLAQSSAYQHTESTFQTNNAYGHLQESYNESNHSFNFSVVGELDEDELNAISDLVDEIANTVDKFEKGNIEAALNHSKNISFDSSELSAYSLDIRTSEHYRAIDLYQQTALATEPAAEQAEYSENKAQEVSPTSINLNDYINNLFNSAQSTNIGNIEKSIDDIFSLFFNHLGDKADQQSDPIEQKQTSERLIETV